MVRRIVTHAWLALLVALGGCGETGTPWQWQLPPDFPVPRVPEDNPLTVEKAELGRHLFYDRRLSGNGTQACASCHRQELGFSDGLPRAVGSTGEHNSRNALALVNVAYNTTLTWAHPGLEHIEQQLLIPMFGEFPVELGISGHETEILQRFRDDARYQELFRRAFPGQRDPVGFANIVKALASFVRTLVSLNSPFDRYAYFQEDDALTASARRGLDLFMSERLECHHCHGGFNFTQSTTHAQSSLIDRPFHNTGLYNLGEDGGYPASDTGLYALTGVAEHMGRFRAPTLRNVAVTAPYMHDGSIATLEEVIDFYAAGGRVIAGGELAGDGRRNPHKNGFVKGFELTVQERTDLVQFLYSLTDETFLQDPAFASPSRIDTSFAAE